MATTVNLPSLAEMGIEDRQTANIDLKASAVRVLSQTVQTVDAFWATDLSVPASRAVKAMDRFWSTKIA